MYLIQISSIILLSRAYCTQIKYFSFFILCLFRLLLFPVHSLKLSDTKPQSTFLHSWVNSRSHLSTQSSFCFSKHTTAHLLTISTSLLRFCPVFFRFILPLHFFLRSMQVSFLECKLWMLKGHFVGFINYIKLIV